MTVEPVALAGHREVLVRDDGGRLSRHFVILCFAARWIAGEPMLNEELAEARWLRPAELAGLKTTDGLADIVAAGLRAHGSGGLTALVRRHRGRRDPACARVRRGAYVLPTHAQTRPDHSRRRARRRGDAGARASKAAPRRSTAT